MPLNFLKLKNKVFANKNQVKKAFLFWFNSAVFQLDFWFNNKNSEWLRASYSICALDYAFHQKTLNFWSHRVLFENNITFRTILEQNTFINFLGSEGSVDENKLIKKCWCLFFGTWKFFDDTNMKLLKKVF